MLLDAVTPAQMQAGRVLSGMAMAGFLGARLFGRHAGRVRVGVAVVYCTCVTGFAVYVAFL
jgi:hypothetical protein